MRNRSVTIVGFDLSVHLLDSLKQERSNIKIECIEHAISNPDFKKEVSDDEIKLWKKIPEFGNRFLRVVINPKKKKIVTAFFDRRFKL